MADGCTLVEIERTRQSPDSFPKRRYRCACGQLGHWSTSAMAALMFWRTHAGVAPSVNRRDALRG